MRTETGSISRPRANLTIDLALHICEAVCEGRSLRSVLRKPGMPSLGTFLRTVSEQPEVQRIYETALMVRAEGFAEELVDLADDTSADVVVDEMGRQVHNLEAIARAKLRINTRQWVISRLLPKRYGDRVQVEGKVGKQSFPVEIDHDHAVRIAEQILSAQRGRDASTL